MQFRESAKMPSGLGHTDRHAAAKDAILRACNTSIFGLYLDLDSRKDLCESPGRAHLKLKKRLSASISHALHPPTEGG